MLLAVPEGRAYYFSCPFIDDYLSFQCMSFLFPRVKMLLPVISVFYPFLPTDFFLGLSIGVSAAFGGGAAMSQGVTLVQECIKELNKPRH